MVFLPRYNSRWQKTLERPAESCKLHDVLLGNQGRPVVVVIGRVSIFPPDFVALPLHTCYTEKSARMK